ncbi:hypothetical protein PILCRDRAFT_15479 [Piloderma croceum F 1598]|uniref:Uncharacterized protein n=1 Tax=Piloderma croceum (strain F 1598) TaxID=765440 RepID=A0A0C3EKQ7_PILCF|nr:hypothetical protein PILCRDRAFT_15479 [Piloderma croceum F 1598]
MPSIRSRHTAPLPQLNRRLHWANTHSTRFQLPHLISTPMTGYQHEGTRYRMTTSLFLRLLARADPDQLGTEPEPFRVPNVADTTAGTSTPESPQIPSSASAPSTSPSPAPANQHRPWISDTSLGSPGSSQAKLANSQLEHSRTRSGEADEDEYGEIIEQTARVNPYWMNSTRKDFRGGRHSHLRLGRSSRPSFRTQQLPRQAKISRSALLTIVSGDSVNGMGTDGSANPQLSWSSTTANSSTGSGGMNTPATSHLTLSGPAIPSPGSIPPTRWSRVPTVIDICSISSQAQAEGLVQRARQSILNMELETDIEPLGSGHSPLSAKLAAYGESSRSPRIRDIRALGSPRTTNHSRGSANQDGQLLAIACSHSAAAIEVRAESKHDITMVETVATPQPSPFSGRSPPQHQSINPSLERSRTPDLPGEDSTSAGHVVLSRYSSAPPFESFADMQTANGKHDPETRYVSSANKLTKMGFSANHRLHPTVLNSVSPQVHEQKPRFGLESFFEGKA